jgi:hypothetical protein
MPSDAAEAAKYAMTTIGNTSGFRSTNTASTARVSQTKPKLPTCERPTKNVLNGSAR